jgi:hypothetical protein
MAYIKGGRGKKAPYDSIVMRIPVPLKETIESIIEHYRESLDIETALGEDQRVKNDIPDIETALDLARSILSQKKSAKISLAKLLTALYSKDIVL